MFPAQQNFTVTKFCNDHKDIICRRRLDQAEYEPSVRTTHADTARADEFIPRGQDDETLDNNQVAGSLHPGIRNPGHRAAFSLACGAFFCPKSLFFFRGVLSHREKKLMRGGS